MTKSKIKSDNDFTLSHAISEHLQLLPALSWLLHVNVNSADTWHIGWIG